jgi:outer membrane protein
MTSLPLRPALGCLAFAVALCAASPARAQYANHSIGFEAGYMVFDSDIGAGDGPDVGVEATVYLDNGFELYFRTLIGLHKDQAADKNAIGAFPAVGVRYLFSDESLRPYVGVTASYLHFFGGDTLPGSLFAVSPNLGLEYFFEANTALGLQAEYHRVLALNGPSGNAFAAVARIAWGF